MSVCRACAVCLLVLVCSPCTAPFSTFDAALPFGEVPASDAASSKTPKTPDAGLTGLIGAGLLSATAASVPGMVLRPTRGQTPTPVSKPVLRL